MPRLSTKQMRAAEDLLSKLNAVMHYGEHDGEEVVMTAFVAEVQPARPDYLEEDAKLPPPDTELYFVHEDEWVLAEINHVGKSLR